MLAEIIRSPRPQWFWARVERVYSARRGLAPGCEGKEIEFVGAPNHWGAAPLTVGDRALVFVRFISGRLYAEAWRGHMVVEEVAGAAHAVFPHRELWLSEEVPEPVRSAARQDPRRPYASVIPFVVVEGYLQSLLADIERGE